MDISVFTAYRDTLQTFLSNSNDTISENKQNLFKDELYEQINMFVQNYCREKHLILETLNRADKQALIVKLYEKGAFNGKNATNYIACILNISRTTVYNYLKESCLLETTSIGGS